MPPKRTRSRVEDIDESKPAKANSRVGGDKANAAVLVAVMKQPRSVFVAEELLTRVVDFFSADIREASTLRGVSTHFRAAVSASSVPFKNGIEFALLNQHGLTDAQKLLRARFFASPKSTWVAAALLQQGLYINASVPDLIDGKLRTMLSLAVSAGNLPLISFLATARSGYGNGVAADPKLYWMGAPSPLRAACTLVAQDPTSPLARAVFSKVLSLPGMEDQVEQEMQAPQQQAGWGHMHHNNQTPRSSIAWVIFRRADECDSQQQKEQHAAFSGAVGWFNMNNGLAPVPRIPLELIRMMITTGVSRKMVDEVDAAGDTLLHKLCRCYGNKALMDEKYHPLLELLLEYSAKAPPAGSRWNPVTDAVMALDVKALKIFIKHKYSLAPGHSQSDVRHFNHNNNNNPQLVAPLSLLGRSQQGGGGFTQQELVDEKATSVVRLLAAEKVQWLHDRDWNVNLINPLLRATCVGDVKLMQTLVRDCGCQELVNAEVHLRHGGYGPKGERITPLQFCAALANMELCKTLIDLGAQVDKLSLRYAREQTTDEAAVLLKYLKTKQ